MQRDVACAENHIANDGAFVGEIDRAAVFRVKRLEGATARDP